MDVDLRQVQRVKFPSWIESASVMPQTQHEWGRAMLYRELTCLHLAEGLPLTKHLSAKPEKSQKTNLEL